MGSVPTARDKRSGVTGDPQTFRSPTAIIVWWVWVLFAVANLIDLAVQGRDHETLIAAGILLVATGAAYVCALRPRILADQAGVTVVNPLRDHHAGWATVTKVDLADLVRVHCQLSPNRVKVIYAWAVHYSRRRKLVAQAKANRQSARASAPGPTFGLGSYGGGRLSGFGVSSSGYGRTPAPGPASTAEADAERIVGLLNEYVTAAQAEAIYAGSPDPAAAGRPADPAQHAPAQPAPAQHAPAQPAPAEAAQPASPQPASPQQTGWLDPLRSTWSGQALLALFIPALLLVAAIFA